MRRRPRAPDMPRSSLVPRIQRGRAGPAEWSIARLGSQNGAPGGIRALAEQIPRRLRVYTMPRDPRDLLTPMEPREEHATPRPTLTAPESMSPEISSARCRRSPRKALAWADTSETGCRPNAYATTHRTNTRPWNLIWNSERDVGLSCKKTIGPPDSESPDST